MVATVVLEHSILFFFFYFFRSFFVIYQNKICTYNKKSIDLHVTISSDLHNICKKRENFDIKRIHRVYFSLNTICKCSIYQKLHCKNMRERQAKHIENSAKRQRGNSKKRKKKENNTRLYLSSAFYIKEIKCSIYVVLLCRCV